MSRTRIIFLLLSLLMAPILYKVTSNRLNANPNPMAISAFPIMSEVRNNAEVIVKKEGTGALVLPGRYVHIHSPQGKSVGIMTLNDYFFTVGGEDDKGEFKAAVGLKQGSVVLVKTPGSMLGNLFVIAKVCDQGGFFGGIDCKPLPPDKIRSDLKDCVSFDNEKCKAAVKTPMPYIRLESSDGFYAEYCVLKGSESCRELIKYLMGNEGMIRVQNLEVLRQLSGLTPSEIKKIKVEMDPSGAVNTLLDDLDNTITPEVADDLFKFIEKDVPDSPRILNQILSGLYGANKETKGRYISALGGAVSPLPQKLKSIIMSRGKKAKRKQELDKFLESSTFESSIATKISRAGWSNYDVSKATKEEMMVVDASGYNGFMACAIMEVDINWENYKDAQALNIKNAKGETILHLLVETGKVFGIRDFLTKVGSVVDINAQDADGQTALNWAKNLNYPEIEKILNEHK